MVLVCADIPKLRYNMKNCLLLGSFGGALVGLKRIYNTGFDAKILIDDKDFTGQINLIRSLK